MANVNLLGLDLDLSALAQKVALKQARRDTKGHTSKASAHVSSAWCVLQFVQRATFRLNVTEVQFDTRNHNLERTAGPC